MLIDCGEVREQLGCIDDEPNDELDAALRERIATHLAECAECAALFNEIRKATTLLRGVRDFGDLALPDGFDDRLRQKLSPHLGIAGRARAEVARTRYKRMVAWIWAHFNSPYERAVAERKRALFSGLRGDVLEIGPGTGSNLIHYRGREIGWTGVEPNPYMHVYLKREAEKLGIAADLHIGVAEHLELANDSVDAVVATLVLCSVTNLNLVLSEILRVLKPGGQFFFMEHVAAPRGTWLRRLQQWVQPVWQPVLDNCRPDQETWLALERAGFARVKYDRFTGPIPIASPHIIGIATKHANRTA